MIRLLRRLLCRHQWEATNNPLMLVCAKCGELGDVRCPHEWSVLDRTVLPSPYDQLVPGQRYAQGSDWVYRRVLVLTVKCDKCGELRVERTENP